MITSTTSNNEMDEIMKLVRFLEDSGLLIKGVSKTIENKVKKQKYGFLSMLLAASSASSLKNY